MSPWRMTFLYAAVVKKPGCRTCAVQNAPLGFGRKHTIAAPARTNRQARKPGSASHSATMSAMNRTAYIASRTGIASPSAGRCSNSDHSPFPMRVSVHRDHPVPPPSHRRRGPRARASRPRGGRGRAHRRHREQKDDEQRDSEVAADLVESAREAARDRGGARRPQPRRLRRVEDVREVEDVQGGAGSHGRRRAAAEGVEEVRRDDDGHCERRRARCTPPAARAAQARRAGEPRAGTRRR